MTLVQAVRSAAAILAIPALAVTAFISLDSAAANEPSCYSVKGVSATPCYQKDFQPADPPPVALKKPTDATWWVDTDGEDPGVAGCHIEVTSATDAKRPKGGRVFGEACQPGNILVETNPGKAVIHAHVGDKGNPFRIDCNNWCKTKAPNKKGTCKTEQITVTYQTKSVSCQSAKCVCE
jgi:hypothetical protein